VACRGTGEPTCVVSMALQSGQTEDQPVPEAAV
jgi:hypothetical protein